MFIVENRGSLCYSYPKGVIMDKKEERLEIIILLICLLASAIGVWLFS